jgi:hypothetical protein
MRSGRCKTRTARCGETPSPPTAPSLGERVGVRGRRVKTSNSHRACARVERRESQSLPSLMCRPLTQPSPPKAFGGEGFPARTRSGERALRSTHADSAAADTPSPPTASSLGERVGVRGRRVKTSSLHHVGDRASRKPIASEPDTPPPHPTLSPENIRGRGLSARRRSSARLFSTQEVFHVSGRRFCHTVAAAAQRLQYAP